MTTETWTTLKLINWTKDYFEKKGIPDARLEAETLLAHALGWKRIDLYSRFEAAVPSEKLAVFRQMVKRRAKREPPQYILGETEFCGLTLKTDRRALIPRPESELIIEAAAGLARDLDQPLIADIGTGAGNLAIAAAVRLPKARIVACDISEEALALARENAGRHNVLARIDLRLGDFEDTLAEFAGRVDILMANPPYVAEQELAGLAPELREHEPVVALVSGPEGTEHETRILGLAGRLLTPGGHLVMEIAAGQAERVRKMVADQPALKFIGFEKDFALIERVVVVRRKVGG